MGPAHVRLLVHIIKLTTTQQSAVPLPPSHFLGSVVELSFRSCYCCTPDLVHFSPSVISPQSATVTGTKVSALASDNVTCKTLDSVSTPSTTCPNTICLPSNSGVAWRGTMNLESDDQLIQNGKCSRENSSSGVEVDFIAASPRDPSLARISPVATQ
eukprot:TRINITY_DN52936_c0_g1_i2.p2 TRINITY_DN52936_c0_g1~~TRINITY_DN52936_c0_g1_i2.p2  ORF type:complete len:157 (-),score=3.46 TRINITY_DN52936_c0_g1_i2:239-709(-)